MRQLNIHARLDEESVQFVLACVVSALECLHKQVRPLPKSPAFSHLTVSPLLTPPSALRVSTRSASSSAPSPPRY